MFPVSDVIPSRAKPIVTIALIALTVGGFLYGLRLGDFEFHALLGQFGVVPADFAWTSFFTSLLLHTGWLHITANAIYLWLFGSNVEDVFGGRRFLIFYFFCGATAALAHVAAHPWSTMPLVGASGAVAGVMGAYLVLFPGSRVLTAFYTILFLDLIEVPAAFYVGLWFVIQLFTGVGSMAPETAHGTLVLWPNVVGFVAGALCGLYSRFRTASLREYWR
jgi:membrane associated rhomboid family serine protease